MTEKEYALLREKAKLKIKDSVNGKVAELKFPDRHFSVCAPTDMPKKKQGILAAELVEKQARAHYLG